MIRQPPLPPLLLPPPPNQPVLVLVPSRPVPPSISSKWSKLKVKVNFHPPLPYGGRIRPVSSSSTLEEKKRTADTYCTITDFVVKEARRATHEPSFAPAPASTLLRQHHISRRPTATNKQTPKTPAPAPAPAPANRRHGRCLVSPRNGFALLCMSSITETVALVARLEHRVLQFHS